MSTEENKTTNLVKRQSPAGYPATPYLDLDGIPESNQGWDFLRVLHLLWRRKLLVTGIAILGGAAGFGLTRIQMPMYRAQVSIEIQGLNEAFLNLRDVSATDRSYDIMSQVRILQSNSLRDRTLRAMNEKPGEPTNVNPAEPPPAQTLVPTPIRITRAEAIDIASRNITVIPSRENRIIDLLSDSPDPNIAAEFANTLASEYVDENVEARVQSAERTAQFLTRTLSDLKAKLEASQDALQQYAQASGLTFASEEATAAEESLRHLQSELSEAQSDRLANEARSVSAATSPPESLAEVLTDSRLTQYQLQLTEMRRQLADLTVDFTDSYPRVQRTRAQIRELEAALAAHRKNLIQRLNNDVQAATHRETLLTKAYETQQRLVEGQSDRRTHYDILKREVESTRRLYDAMLQKVKEAGISTAMLANNIRILDHARPPSRPFSPNVPLTTLAGLVSGLFAGMTLVLARDFADRRIYGPGDTTQYLRLPELGIIPKYKPEKLFARPAAFQLLKSRASSSSDRVELASWYRKTGLLAESFRSALVSILRPDTDGTRPRVLVVTSPGPREGKTSVVSNLAIALAEINQKVLLIDADLRLPSLHEIFNAPNNRGLTDILQSRQLDIDCLCLEVQATLTQVPGLWLLPSGPGTASISNSLHSPKFAELIHRLLKDFDTILIDTPPMLLPDARVISRVSDGVILVVRSGNTHLEAAASVAQRFQEDGTPILGTIINCWNPGSRSTYYSRYRPA